MLTLLEAGRRVRRSVTTSTLLSSVRTFQQLGGHVAAPPPPPGQAKFSPWRPALAINPPPHPPARPDDGGQRCWGVSYLSER